MFIYFLPCFPNKKRPSDSSRHLKQSPTEFQGIHIIHYWSSIPQNNQYPLQHHYFNHFGNHSLIQICSFIWGNLFYFYEFPFKLLPRKQTCFLPMDDLGTLCIENRNCKKLNNSFHLCGKMKKIHDFIKMYRKFIFKFRMTNLL